jgi:protein tyrosine phosphatase (PTP) superfamily phosphohydrolase (DUF442 family)
MENIINFRVIDYRIASGGQPTSEQFPVLAATGCQVIVNLAMPTSVNAIPNEGELVTQSGMTYIHIPVVWTNPQLDNFQEFVGIMQVYHEKKMFVHCAKNFRSSCFLYLYRVLFENVNPDIAAHDMLSVFQPNQVWQDFIDEVFAHYQASAQKESNHG